MSDFTWLNLIPAPTFAFRANDESRAQILFWNEAMEDHSDVPASLVTAGKLAALEQRLLRAHLRHARTASLGSLGTFEFKTGPDDVVIASLSARANRDAEDEKVMFLAMAAHDLRSPLRHIRGLLDEVRDNFQDMGDGKLDLLNMIEDVGERARVFTNDVISYTWATHVQQSETQKFDLQVLARDIFQSVDLLDNHTLICPALDLDSDKLAVQIALRNLFDNAVRHGGSNQMSISLKIAALDEINSLRFTVTDDGNGASYPAEFFVKATDLRKSSSFGLLGVKRLIEERGGEISAVEVPGSAGSAITFTLPGCLVPVQEQEQAQSKAS